jgi:hypothetical protein
VAENSPALARRGLLEPAQKEHPMQSSEIPQQAGLEERRLERYQHPGRALGLWFESQTRGREIFLVLADETGLVVASSPMSSTRAKMMAALTVDPARSRALPQQVEAIEVEGRVFRIACAGTRQAVSTTLSVARHGCERILRQRQQWLG